MTYEVLTVASSSLLMLIICPISFSLHFTTLVTTQHKDIFNLSLTERLSSERN